MATSWAYTAAATLPPEISKALRFGEPAPAGLSPEEQHAFDQLDDFYKHGLGYALEMANRHGIPNRMSDAEFAELDSNPPPWLAQSRANRTGKRPVWVALKRDSEWRWLRGRDDSPWYPTMRLFRQNTADDWTSVFAAMAAALTA